LSEKSVAQKLLIKENYQLLVINSPKNYKTIMGGFPPNVTFLTKSNKPVDFVQLFVTSKEELQKDLEMAKTMLKPKGLLWVTYPKGTSQIKTDINRDTIREYARSIGLEGVAMISVDDTWSALRLKIV